MLKKLFGYYKVPFLITLTLSVVLVALGVEKEITTIVLILAGTILGTFVLDLDYFLSAYFLEPTSDFAKDLRSYIKHKDFGNVFSYIYHHRDDIKDKTLNSMIFQIVLAGASLLVVSSETTILLKALVISAFANSLYRMAEHIFEHKTQDWFWALKTPPTTQTLRYYSAILLSILILSLGLF